MESARRLAGRARAKRFYKEVTVAAEEGGYALRLDGKRAVTPGRNPLVVTNLALAEAVGGEWRAQGEDIDPGSMPATRLANSALDGVAARMDDVRGEVLAYAGTDLLTYRAADPEGLVARQREAWDPLLAWAEKRFGSRFILAEGMSHVVQPDKTLAAIAEAIAGIDDPLRLAALHLATTLTGSALIALALSAGAIDADAAWAAAHVDEDWNNAQWGIDADAAKARARRLQDFRAAALVLSSAAEAGT